VLDGFDELISKLRILPQETWDGTEWDPEIAGWEDFGWGGVLSLGFCEFF